MASSTDLYNGCHPAFDQPLVIQILPEQVQNRWFFRGTSEGIRMPGYGRRFDNRSLLHMFITPQDAFEGKRVILQQMSLPKVSKPPFATYYMCGFHESMKNDQALVHEK